MANLSPEERKEIAANAAKAKAELAKLPKATHFGTLPFGDNMQCFVLSDGRRVISGRGMTEAIGMKGRGPGVVRIADHKLIRAYGDSKLIEAISNPIKFVGKNPKGNSETSDGAEAVIMQQFNSQFEHFQDDAPACDICGSITVRNGTCYKCFNCGNSMGCS